MLHAISVLLLTLAVNSQSQDLPSPPTITSTTTAPTSVTLDWTQPAGENVTDFTVAIVFDVIGCNGVDGSSDDVTISAESARTGDSAYRYEATNLQENSDVTVRLSATNLVGTSSDAFVTARTQQTAPSSPPTSIAAQSESPTNFTVTWGRVPCVDRNTEVTQYVVRVAQTQVGVFRGFVVFVSWPRNYTVTGLIPRTEYTVGVAAQRQDVSASPVVFLAGVEDNVMVNTSPATDLGFFHNGLLLPNNSVIASIEDDLFCLTTNSSCCENNVTGNWFLPGSTLPVPSTEDASNIDQVNVSRRAGAVVLGARASGSPPTGVYSCQVPDDGGVIWTLYASVGLGSSLIISDLSLRDSTSLVCTSTGRPVNSVTWLKNGEVLDFSSGTDFVATQSLVDPVEAGYSNVLSSEQTSNFVGTFVCRLTDFEGSEVSRTFIVNDVTVSNEEFVIGSRATATCTSNADISAIMSITWQNSTGDILNQTTSDNQLELVFDPVTDSPSLQGAEFTCSVAGGAEVATQSFQVALIIPDDPLTVTTSAQGSSVAGTALTLTCIVNKTIAGFLQQPTATWLNNDQELVVPQSGSVTVSNSADNSFAMAVLVFPSLRLSQGFQYTCVATLMSLGNTITVEGSYSVSVILPPPMLSITTLAIGSDYLGSEVTLTCTATPVSEVDGGNVIGTFTWYSSGGELTDGGQFQIDQVENLVSELTIASLRVADVNFTCSAFIHLQMDPGRISVAGSDFFVVTRQLRKPSVEISSIPIDTNYFAGLRLNLTCTVNVSVIDGTVPTVRVSWMKNGSELLNSDRIFVEGETTRVSDEGLYERSVFFRPLEIEDEAVYTCSANLSVREGGFEDTASSNTSVLRIAIERQCFQLRIELGESCTSFDVNINELLNSIVEAVNSVCDDCGFSNQTITEGNVMCFDNNPNAITFYGRVQGVLGYNVSAIVGVIKNWLSSVQYAGKSHDVSTNAPVKISLASTTGTCLPVDNTPMVSTSTQGGLGDTDATTTDGTTIIHSVCYTCVLIFALLALIL